MEGPGELPPNNLVISWLSSASPLQPPHPLLSRHSDTQAGLLAVRKKSSILPDPARQGMMADRQPVKPGAPALINKPVLPLTLS